MRDYFQRHLNKNFLLVLGTIVLLAVLGYGGYSFFNLKQTLKLTQESLIQAGNRNADLIQKVTQAENAANDYGKRVGEIVTTVGNLQKLYATDPELLKKYSKVYFLNENYVPKSLSNIATSSLYLKDRVLEIHSGVKPFLEKLIDASLADHLNLLIVSAYRSYGTQSVLKSAYKVNYGVGANQFSAEQGYSEHQLATTVDFTNPKIGDTFSGFSKTAEYAWLLKNAYKYGFILSYPENNSYYVYEPWHWRFVGVFLSNMLFNENKHFYDLSQREIDPYLLKFFDSNN